MNNKIKWVILVLVILLTINVSAQEDINMLIGITLSDDGLSVDEVSLVEGEAYNPVDENPTYSLKVSSLSGESYSVNTSFVMFEFVDSYTLDVDPIRELKQSSNLFFFPYYRDVDKLEVFKDRQLVLTYDLSDYRICDFNGICFGDEDLRTCPEDCAEEGQVDEGVQLDEAVLPLPSEKNLFEEDSKDKNKSLIFIGIGALALLIFIIILFRRKRK